jgi:hypothetical protein
MKRMLPYFYRLSNLWSSEQHKFGQHWPLKIIERQRDSLNVSYKSRRISYANKNQSDVCRYKCFVSGTTHIDFNWEPNTFSIPNVTDFLVYMFEWKVSVYWLLQEIDWGGLSQVITTSKQICPAVKILKFFYMAIHNHKRNPQRRPIWTKVIQHNLCIQPGFDTQKISYFSVYSYKIIF